jgi:hypothetical protein
MNTVMRTLGGALGGQISATFVADQTHHGLAAQAGYTETFVMSTCIMLVCLLASTLIPGAGRARPRLGRSRGLAQVQEAS